MHRSHCRGKLKSLRKIRPEIPKKPKDTRAEDMMRDSRCGLTFVYLAERTWASALTIRESASQAGERHARQRKHMLGRLKKAVLFASNLRDLVWGEDSLKAARLHSQIYLSLLEGQLLFEKQSWKEALKQYSIARLGLHGVQAYEDFLRQTVDPALRYAAHQISQSGESTAPLKIAQRVFPDADAALREVIPLAAMQPVSDEQLAQVKWRSYVAHIDDPNILVALGQVADLKKSRGDNGSESLEYYDKELATWAEAEEAVRHALAAPDSDMNDDRMQNLQIAGTYTRYNVLARRIQRGQAILKSLNRLKQRQDIVKVLDGIIEGIEEICDLPGVPNDVAFMELNTSFKRYFKAYRCIIIAEAYAAAQGAPSALALTVRALEHLSVIGTFEDMEDSLIEVSKSEISHLKDACDCNLLKYRALSTLEKFDNDRVPAEQFAEPLLFNLDTFPRFTSSKPTCLVPNYEGDDNSIVLTSFLRPITAKPIFYDIAFNHIEAMKHGLSSSSDTVSTSSKAAANTDKPNVSKRGLFGFLGR